MKVKIADSNSIVLIEQLGESSHRFHLETLDRTFTEKKIQDSLLQPNVKVFVDCDEDAFLIQRNSLEKENLLTLLWENQKTMVDPEQLDEILRVAPALFPMLALDKNDTPLMLAWGKVESIKEAIESGKGTYFSRSRNKKWIKGEDSGHLQYLKSIYYCSNPFYIIYVTEQIGAACHTGYYTCFFRQIVSENEIVTVYPHKVGEVK